MLMLLLLFFSILDPGSIFPVSRGCFCGGGEGF